MKIRKFFFAVIAGLGVSFCMNNFVLAESANFKTAVIDVGHVLDSSAEIKKLNKEHNEQIDELVLYINDARKEIALVSDENKKKKLEEKFRKELLEKKEKIDKNYYDKLTDIDKDISKTVEQLAKENNYDLILSKDAVLYSKNDLTPSLVKTVSRSK